MKKGLIADLYSQFTSLSVTPNPQELELYLESFPHSRLRDELRSVPIFFHRAWIKTCINGHLDGVKKTQKLIKKNRPPHEIQQAYTTSRLWLAHAERVFEAFHMIHVHLVDDTVQKHIITADDLRLGDIVLSYKTKLYLRHSPLSRMIQLMTRSAITHAMFACHYPRQPATLLMSDDTTEGLGIIPATTEPGEIYIVFEPLPHPALPTVYRSIHNYYRLALLKKTDFSLQQQFPFPGLKCELACLIGALYVASGYIRRKPLMLPNPLAQADGMFCSEFVDTLFREAGIQLTPRSEHRAIVGPVEFLYSPHIRFKGIIGDTRTIRNAQQEIVRQFGKLMKPITT